MLQPDGNCWSARCGGALLLAVLIAAGQQVTYVPGRTVNRMAGMFRGEGKTDAKDARLIVETARMCPSLAIFLPG
jgi:hypothetical protein